MKETNCRIEEDGLRGEGEINLLGGKSNVSKIDPKAVCGYRSDSSWVLTINNGISVPATKLDMRSVSSL